MRQRFLYYDGTYEYFGKDHIPYALLALLMLFCVQHYSASSSLSLPLSLFS